MKKILIGLGLLIAGAALGQVEFDRRVEWSSLDEIRRLFKDAYGVTLTPVERADAPGSCLRDGARILGHSDVTGIMCVMPVSKRFAPEICGSINMEVKEVDEEKQVLVCTVPSKQKV